MTTNETPEQDAPVYDATGNVRPTDARYAGPNRVKYTQQELANIREQEIRDNTALLAKRQAELQEQNDKRLRESVEGITPTLDDADAPEPADDADAGELKGAELEQALKDRGLPTTGTADEKRARVAEHDAAQA